MNATEYEARIAALEKEIRILKKKLSRSEANRVIQEELLETHSSTLKARNVELEKSRELIRQSESRYRVMAFHDTLTGLPNRVMFQERFGRAIAYAQLYHAQVAILFVDLDEFKPINDKWGHDAGDQVLRVIADRLRDCVRGNDMVARIGGDEFALLVEDLQGLQDAGYLAERILEEVTQPINVQEHTCALGASIGISCYPMDGTDVNSLLQNADTAMYDIKKCNRNGYRFYRDLPKEGIR